MRKTTGLLGVALVTFVIGCSAADEQVDEGTPQTSQVKAAATKPPNIVFILTDDLDEGVFNGGSRLKSLLVDQGTSFKNHLVTVSLCCPSRAATLRGQFAHNSGIFSNGGATGGFGKFHGDGLENSTVATWLQDGGYRTTLVGKYMNGYPSTVVPKSYVPPGWTRWFSPNGGNPYSEYNYDLNQNGTTVFLR